MSKTTSSATPRQRLLRAATSLFCQRGFNAVGVDAIIAEAGTAKTSLYKAFGSKDRLVEEVLDSEGKAWRDWFVDSLEKSGGSARDKLDSIFPVLGQWFKHKRFYGCPFINAVGEHDKSNDRLRNLALQHKRQVLGYVLQLCQDAGVRNPERLTHEIALLMDGAIVAALITKEPGVASVAHGAMRVLIERDIVADEAKIRQP